MSKNEPFNDWYKHLFEHEMPDPPGQVWEGIRDQLDVDEVWQGIEQQLDKKQRVNHTLRVALAIAATFFLLAGARWWFNQSSGPSLVPVLSGLEETNREIGEKNIDFPSAIYKMNKSDLWFSDRAGKREEEIPALKTVPPSRERKAEHTKKQSASANNSQDERAPGAASPSPPAELARLPAGMLPTEENGTDLATVDEKNIRSDENREKIPIYLAFSGNLGNSWMLNQKTLDGLQPTNLTAVNMQASRSYGFIVGTDYPRFLNYELEGLFKYTSGQMYQEYIHGKYTANAITLNYSKYDLRASMSLPVPGWMKQNKHFFSTGPYLAYLRDATRELDQKAENIAYEYKNLDLGLSLSYKWEINVTGNWVIHTGLKSNIGLMNIFAGTEKVPSYFNKTYNGAIMFTFALGYSTSF
jgi:hypothetical protein